MKFKAIDVVMIACDDCGKYISTIPRYEETKREQMKRAVGLWNAAQKAHK